MNRSGVCAAEQAAFKRFIETRNHTCLLVTPVVSIKRMIRISVLLQPGVGQMFWLL